MRVGIIGVGHADMMRMSRILQNAKGEIQIVHLSDDLVGDKDSLRKAVDDNELSAIVCSDKNSLCIRADELIDSINIQLAEMPVHVDDLLNSKKLKKFEPKQDFSDMQWKGGQPNCLPHKKRKRGVNRSK